MRDIRFRGIRLSISSEKVWAYGYYFYDKALNKHFIYGEYGTICEVDPNTIGQYTGIKDKNGKETYEGDIVRIYDGEELIDQYENVDVIEWSDGKEYCIGFGLFSCFEYEVIGNIYEQPELLKNLEEGE